jgi:hypothetical protein
MKNCPPLTQPFFRWVARGLALFLTTLLVQTHAEGLVTHLSGPVQVQQADGRGQLATVGTRVVEGQTLATGKGAYARIEMTDGGEMVLRPESQLKIESYRFEKANPLLDNSVFRLLQGGLRAITGLVSKRGNRNAYQMNTVTATIGIRGTQFDVRLCQGNCGALGDGTYVSVRSGSVAQGNSFGELTLAAGQVGYSPPNSAPVRLPRDPGIGFTPPPGIPKLDEKKKLEAAAKEALDPAAGSNGTSAASTTGGAGAASSLAEDGTVRPVVLEGNMTTDSDPNRTSSQSPAQSTINDAQCVVQ